MRIGRGGIGRIVSIGGSERIMRMMRRVRRMSRTGRIKSTRLVSLWAHCDKVPGRLAGCPAG